MSLLKHHQYHSEWLVEMEIRNYFDLLFHHYVDFVDVQHSFVDVDDDDDANEFLLRHR